MIITSGPVLELGAGLGSTLTLHGLCGSLGRSLTTIESDEEWLARFINYRRSWHILRKVGTFLSLPEYVQNWGLAFIDHGIAEERGISIIALQQVPIIVVHDTCYPWLYGYQIALSLFKYRWDWRINGPMTTIISQTIDVVGKFERFDL